VVARLEARNFLQPGMVSAMAMVATVAGFCGHHAACRKGDRKGQNPGRTGRQKQSHSVLPSE
jgi:hypothetical protein